MTVVVMIVLLVGAAALQLALPGPAALAQAKAPLLLAVVVYYALNRDSRSMLLAAFLGGLLHDVLDPMPPGFSSLLFCAAGLVAARFRNVVLSQSPATPAFFTLVGGFALTLATWLLLERAGLASWPAGRVLWRAAATGILGAVCGPIVYGVAGGFDRLVGNIEHRQVLNGIEQPLE